MKIGNPEIQLLKRREAEFLDLVENSSHAELARCAKFLAMYLALYREQFGEIPVADYNRLLQPAALDKELLDIIGAGMQEASAMLRMVMQQGIRESVTEERPLLN